MGLVDFNDDDVLAAKLVKPDWYRVKITDVDERISKKGTSTNFFLTGKIICASDTGNTEFSGVPTPHWMFNTSPYAKRFIVGFLEALGVKVGPGTRVDMNSVKDKEIDVFIENAVDDDGRMTNVIKDKYRAVRA